MQKIIKVLIKYWPIILLLFLTFLLRIYNIENLFYFTYDESIPAFVARRLILWHHIPLIGAVTPFNFHLGPYFYWMLSLILYLGKLNPIAWGWAAAVISTATAAMMYLVASSLSSKKVGITATILWSFSYLANIYDRHFWALYWGPLVSLVVIFSLLKIIKGHHKFVYLLAATIAFAIHADLSNLLFLPMSIIVWLIYKLPVKKYLTVTLVIITLSFLPLLIFDLRHNFSNTRPVVDFIKQGRNSPTFDRSKLISNLLIFPESFPRLIYTFGDNQVAKQYSYCQIYAREKFQAIPIYLIWISSFTIFAFIFTLLKTSTFISKKKAREYILLQQSSCKLEKTPAFKLEKFIIFSLRSYKKSSWFLISLLIVLYFLGVQVYGTIFKADIFEHYISGVFAAFLLIVALIIGMLNRNLWLAAIAIFVVFNLYKLSQAQNDMGLLNKKLAIEYTMKQVGNKEFSLESLSTCWRYSGYRYLFTIFGREPVKSYVDPNLAYLYGTTPIAQHHPETVVSFIFHDFVPETSDFYDRYARLKSHQTSSAYFGRIEVLIINNSSGWFDKAN